MINNYRKIGIEGNFILIKTIYKETTSNVIRNGEKALS